MRIKSNLTIKNSNAKIFSKHNQIDMKKKKTYVSNWKNEINGELLKII
jgi:hypothetical protein